MRKTSSTTPIPTVRSGRSLAVRGMDPALSPKRALSCLAPRRKLSIIIGTLRSRVITPAVATAPHGYFRLRDEGYDDADLARWAGTMQGGAGWQDVFVYFKHEAAGKGPALAAQLAEILSAT